VVDNVQGVTSKGGVDHLLHRLLINTLDAKVDSSREQCRAYLPSLLPPFLGLLEGSKATNEEG